MPSISELVQRVLAGDRRALARAMRFVDDRLAGSQELLKLVWPRTGSAWILGVTGSPGVGKSTLCDKLIAAFRARARTVGVVAVDPTSPYSGGAILADRIRMSHHATDDGVFIRSLATRGHLGGLSGSARDVVRLLDASGHDVVLVETVGVGQDELEITRTAQTSLVVVAPGMGDSVQAIKAGILECADVFAVNKADRDGADATARDLEVMLSLGERTLGESSSLGHAMHHAAAAGAASRPAAGEGWTPPVVKCAASRGDGVEDLVAALEKHRAWVEGTEEGRARRRAQLAEEMRESLRDALLGAALQELGARIEASAREVESRRVDPYTATERLIEEFRGRDSASG